MSDEQSDGSPAPAHNYRLVLIEWEDSARPDPDWRWMSDFGKPSIMKCRSVGWLVHDGDDVKSLVPNRGQYQDEESDQACGLIRIPTRSVIRTVRLVEA